MSIPRWSKLDRSHPQSSFCMAAEAHLTSPSSSFSTDCLFHFHRSPHLHHTLDRFVLTSYTAWVVQVGFSANHTSCKPADAQAVMCTCLQAVLPTGRSVALVEAWEGVSIAHPAGSGGPTLLTPGRGIPGWPTGRPPPYTPPCLGTHDTVSQPGQKHMCELGRGVHTQARN